MYCPHCGNKVDDGAEYCSYCGTKLGTTSNPQKTENKDEFFDAPRVQPAQSSEKNVLALVGFILSFFVPLAGLICSCLGLKKCKEIGNSWRGFAIAGIVISAVAMAINIISVCVYVPLYMELLSEIINSGYYY